MKNKKLNFFQTLVYILKVVTHILHTIFCGVAKLISLFVIK